MHIAALDWIFLAILLLSTLIGAWRGLVYEVLSLVNWALAFLLARHFSPAFAAWLPLTNATEAIRYGVAFVLLFVLSVFAGSLLIWLVSQLFKAAGLRPADRALGAVFGLVRGAVVLLAAGVLVGMTSWKFEPLWTESVAAAWATLAVGQIKPVLPPEFGKYLP
jgi:membrane protein required for colicin V production